MSDLSGILPEDFSPEKASEEAGGDYSPLPPGNYNFEIKKTEIVETKDGRGTMVKVQLSVVGQKFKNRVVFKQMTLKHAGANGSKDKPNNYQTAVEIGQADFGALCAACGFKKSAPKRLDELVGKHVQAYVKIRKSDVYGDSNEAQGFKEPAKGAGGVPLGAPDDGFDSGGDDDDIPF